MTHHPSRTASVRLPVRTKTAMAVQSALFVGLLAGIAVLPHDAAYAQGIATQTIPAQQYNIAAGTLGSVLNNFASAAGIELSADAVLTQNKQSSGLRGNYTVAEGFAALLRGQGLQVVRATNGAYSLRAVAANSNEATLPDVVVTAQSQHGAVTEGTGAYATKGITATATRLGLTVRETPQSISVVTRQQMDDRKLENIANVMDATVGITSFRQGVGVDLDQMYSRGFAVSNYMIDGMPVNASSGTLRIGTSMFDRVEVVRGATGLMSGMGQPGAAINLVRKRPLHESYSSIDVEAGNWNRYGVGLDLSRLLNEDGSARGRLVIDFKDKGSWLDRYTSQSRLIYGVTEFDINKDTLLSVGFSHQEDDHDSPMRTGAPIYYSDGSQINLPRSYNNAPDWTFYNTKRSSIFTSLEHTFSNGWRSKAELTYARSELDGLSYYHGGTGAINPVTGLGSSIAPSRWQGVEDRYTLDTNASGPFTLFGRKHELVAGVNVSASDEHVPLYGGLGGAGVGGWLWSWNSTYVGTLGNVWDWNGHGLPKPDFSQNGVTKRKENQQSAYLTSRFNLTDKANLILGARVMNWERTADTTTVAGSFTRTEEKERGVVIPYAGLVYAVNDTWSLYGSYTKIFNPQAPNIRDISDNPLAPEVGTAYELGVKAGFFEERLNANLALFKIQQDKVAEQTNIMGVYRLREGVTTEGVELEVNGALTDGWNIAGGYTFSYSKNKDGSRAMHRIPQHTVKTFTTYKPGGSWDKLTIGGGVNWKGRNGWEGGQYAFQEGYAVASAMARYEFSKQLSLTVNINNLFDKKYYDALLDNGMYGEPRSVMASLKYKF